MYPDELSAKEACAQEILENGFFSELQDPTYPMLIGDGKTLPQVLGFMNALVSEEHLQKFLNLPLECVRDKKIGNYKNACTYISALAAASTGTRPRVDYFYWNERLPQGKQGLCASLNIRDNSLSTFTGFGCVLRVECAGDLLSYLTDATFLAQNNAKHAVAALALSRGLPKHLQRRCEEACERPGAHQIKFCVKQLYPRIMNLTTGQNANTRVAWVFRREEGGG
jgi:hypothetical protein